MSKADLIIPLLLPLLIILVPGLVFGVPAFIKFLKNHGALAYLSSKMMNEVRTLAKLSANGPKYVYLNDFNFYFTADRQRYYLKIESLSNGIAIGEHRFEGTTPVAVLNQFYDWYERNQETIVGARDINDKLKNLR